MKQKKNYGKQRKEDRAEESEFHLSIPDGPVPRHRGGLFELNAGGHFSYQSFAKHCQNEQGGDLDEPGFKAKFTAWSIEDANGVFLYPEGSAFKVFGRKFFEGEPQATYHTGAADYTALMLCLYPTVFKSGVTFPLDQLASYQITASWEPNGPFDLKWVPQQTISTIGEVFTWKSNLYNQKARLKIEIFPSPTGTNVILIGGRLGTRNLPENI